MSLILTGNTSNITIDSTNGITFPNSTLQASAGSVLQVLQTAKTDTFSTTSTSYVDITGFSVSITPKFATSKILVLVNMVVGPANGQFATVNLLRNSTNIAQPTTSATYMSSMNSYPGDDGGAAQPMYSLTWLDSPATTSATTYKLQMLTTGSTAWVNTRPSAQNGVTVSTITVMEIAG